MHNNTKHQWRFINWLKNTPKNQFKKNQLIRKMLIFSILFAIIFGSCAYVYIKILTKTSTSISGQINGFTWFKNDLFSFTPLYNEIDKSYKIWKVFSKITDNWLIWIRLGTVFYALFVLGLCWCYIDNRFIFSLSIILYLGILFNCIDCCGDGKALDYINFNNNWKWLDYTLMLPINFLNISSGKFISSVYNLPDLYICVSIWIILFYIVIYSIVKIKDSIKKAKNNSFTKLQEYYHQKAIVNQPTNQPNGEILLPD